MKKKINEILFHDRTISIGIIIVLCIGVWACFLFIIYMMQHYMFELIVVTVLFAALVHLYIAIKNQEEEKKRLNKILEKWNELECRSEIHTKLVPIYYSSKVELNKSISASLKDIEDLASRLGLDSRSVINDIMVLEGFEADETR